MKSWLKKRIADYFPGVTFDVSVPPDEKMGDYAVNLAFALAKKEGRPPAEVGAALIERLKADEEITRRIERMEFVQPGFVNLFVRKEYLHHQLRSIWAGRRTYGKNLSGGGQKVIVEYPSTNVAKPMHVGHSRPAFIGDALARILDASGYDVLRWDHIGDWGTQFGMIIAAYKMWGDAAKVQGAPLEELNALYVRFQSQAKDDPALLDKARAEFKKLEEKDPENQKLWNWFKEESLKESHAMYRMLGLLPPEAEVGESVYVAQAKHLVDELLRWKIAERSEGAIIARLDAEQLPVALLEKSDGATLYLTRDIASLHYRIEREHPGKILYVVANQQALHLAQLFAIGKKMGIGETELVHVKFGLILGEDGKKLATREGTAVPLSDVLTKIIGLAKNIVREKNPGLSPHEAHVIAHVIGVGALKYNDLKQHPHSDVTFNWNAMLDLSGDSGPYLQYTYARLANIVRKGSRFFQRLFTRPDVHELTDVHELRLIKHLLDFPDVIAESAQTYAPNHVALYLYTLAGIASSYYESVRILNDANKKRRNARLMLVETTATVLRHGLSLLGIETPERI